MENNKNIIIATMFSMAILLGWTWFYEKPRLEQKEALQKAQIEQNKILQKQNKVQNQDGSINQKLEIENSKSFVALKSRKDILQEEKNLRVKISNDNLHGSIYLKGARFDDLTLANYFTKIDKKDEVGLLSPTQSK